MKRLTYFAIIIFVCGAISSCLNHDDYDYTYTDDAAITAFSLGTLNRYTKTVSTKTGNDTVVKSTVTGSSYKFYIDQERQLIYNPDSLPYGTDVAHVICSITAYNSGSVGIKSLTSDSISSFSSSDSIDFTQPREFQAYSLTGSAVRKYEVHVNVHQEKPTAFEWKQMATAVPVASLAAMRGAKIGENIYVMGSDGSEAKLYKADSEAADWTEIHLPSVIDADSWQSLCTIDGRLLASTTSGIATSTDGEEWTLLPSSEGKTLLGTSSRSIIATDSEGNIFKTSDFGETWTSLQKNGDVTYLPTEGITMLHRNISSVATAEEILLVGNRSIESYPDDTTAVEWGYVEETDDYSEPQKFTHYDWTDGSSYKLPRLVGMQCARSGQSYYAIGAGGEGALSLDPFGAIYSSADGGVTWHKETKVTPPTGFTSSTNAFTMFSDSDNFIWIICGGSGNVWRGRINKVGWADVEKAVTE